MKTTLSIAGAIYLFAYGLTYGSEPTVEQVASIRHWLAHTSETSIHQMRGASGNKLYLHKDGHREAVYDENGELVKDGINDGSYNYAHPAKEPLKHFNQDILPWILWGNSRTDPTSVEERLVAYSKALGGGLGTAQATKRATEAYQEIAKTEVRVIEFFVRVIEEGGVDDVYKILKDPTYRPEYPLKIGEGLTKGLNKVISSGDFLPLSKTLRNRD